ncbi:MAG: hypothetical protein A2Y15_03585 [Clostridiales bacterium GWF2_36_10]|nr:MAG: hypothetical protein A2Y15_03585 [Clostridiales bacterium GWF2_36_10]HAN20293.1 hypothetical protein [Clostridiales bacterium]
MDNYDFSQQPQESKITLIDRIYGERTELLQKLLTIASIVLFFVCPIIIIYYLILSLSYVGNMNYEFQVISTYMFSGVTHSITYIVYALILASLKRIISK